MRLKTCLLPILAAVLLIAAPARAEQWRSMRVEQVVTIYGIVVARSSFSSMVSRDRFKVEGRVSSAGLARVFDDTRGTVTAMGRFDNDRARPKGYVADYESGKKKKRTQISFADGRVYRAVNAPPVDTARDDWVPHGATDLVDVADPLSATLVPADREADVCDRTISVFDGVLRADLRLSPAGRGTLSAQGYQGDTVVCRAQFVPVSGYRRDNRSLHYIRDRSQIRIAFAQIGATGVYAPVGVTAETKAGTLTLETKRFELLD